MKLEAAPPQGYEPDSEDDEEDTPADIVRRADWRYQLHFNKHRPDLKDEELFEAIRHNVRMQLKRCGIMVKKKPWRDLIEACANEPVPEDWSGGE